MSRTGANSREARYAAEQAKKREADLRVIVEDLVKRVEKLEENSNDRGDSRCAGRQAIEPCASDTVESNSWFEKG